MTDLETAQRIVSGPWQHAARALEACKAGAWATFVVEAAPPRPLIVGRLGHGSCTRQAAGMFTGPRDEAFDLIPVWASTAHEESSDEWYAVHALRAPDRTLSIVESGPFDQDAKVQLDASVRCSARVWDVGLVVSTSSYSPEVPLAARRGAFGVMKSSFSEVLSVAGHSASLTPRPRIEVPPFCVWFEPRVAGLPDELVVAIRELSITVDDDGEIVRRPGI